MDNMQIMTDCIQKKKPQDWFHMYAKKKEALSNQSNSSFLLFTDTQKIRQYHGQGTSFTMETHILCYILKESTFIEGKTH